MTQNIFTFVVSKTPGMKKSVYILEKKLQQIVTSVYNPALNPHKSALVKLRNESIKRSQNSQCVLAFL